MLLLVLAAQASVHVLPPKAEGNVHASPTLKVCPATPVIPRALAGWQAMTAIAAKATPAPIRIGTGVRATLLPATAVSYPVAPARRSKAGTNGGLFAFDVARAGRYRIALGAGAWIEVVQGTRALTSVAHGHGPECSPVKKMVDFDLKPGRYVLEVAGSPTAMLGLMVAKLD